MADILTTGVTHDDLSMPALVAKIMAISGSEQLSPMQIIKQYSSLAAGAGKVSPGDYVRLRLFDKKFYGDADLQEFIGDRRMRDVTLGINFRRDWYGLLSNKIASDSYLRAYGLPVPEVKAIYAPELRKSDSVLTTREQLEAFLRNKDVYPLFGKPADSQNSLGSIALADPSGASRELIDEIDKKYRTGYVFQERLRPHPAIAALCGDRIATVRFLTIRAEDGVRIFRTCFKIPAGHNVADNYWLGNLLARIDDNGTILSITAGAGLEAKELTEHPDTHAQLGGFVHPEWQAMKAIALQGARLMRYVPLIGWDIACTDRGPVIIEMNEYPDAFLMQFSERRGLLDPTFVAFAKFQERNRVAFENEMKGRYASM